MIYLRYMLQNDFLNWNKFYLLELQYIKELHIEIKKIRFSYLTLSILPQVVLVWVVNKTIHYLLQEGMKEAQQSADKWGNHAKCLLTDKMKWLL